MSSERIVATDTATSLTRPEAEVKGIALLPLHIIWPDRTQDTDFTMPHEKLYEQMRIKGIPTTSGATYSDFMEFYDDLHKKGAREIVSVHITDIKSITVGQAKAASEELRETLPDLSIKVIDSKGISLPQLDLVEKAMDFLNQGATLEETEKGVLEYIPYQRLYVSVSTLDNLKQGGRVTGAQAFIASAFQIFPVIELKDGDVSVKEKVHGQKAGRRRIVELVEEDAEKMKKSPVKLGVIYTQDIEIGEELKARLQEIWREDEVTLIGPTEAGPVLGVHTGPGAAAVAAFWNPPGRS